MAIQLPNYPECQLVDDPTVAQKWEDWSDGFEANDQGHENNRTGG